MKTVLWQMNAETALEFFEEAERRGLTTVLEREQLLIEFAKRKKLQRVWTTKRSKAQFIKDLLKDHKVLNIESKDD